MRHDTAGSRNTNKKTWQSSVENRSAGSSPGGGRGQQLRIPKPSKEVIFSSGRERSEEGG